MPARRPFLSRLGCVVRGAAVLLGIAWMLGGAQVQAQDAPTGWSSLNGPAGRISQLAASPDGASLYAVSVGMTHRKDDQTQWRASDKPARSDALYRSEDGGTTWRPLTNDLPQAPITALYADIDSQKLHAGLRDVVPGCCGGLWRSADRGATWMRVPLARDGLVIQRITRNADGRYLLLGAATSDAAPTSYVYRSADDGRTWASFEVLRAEQNPDAILRDLVASPKDAALFFVVAQSGQLLRSTDAGETWAAIKTTQEVTPESSADARLAVSPDKPDTWLYVRSAAAGKGVNLVVERSEDSGVTWRRMPATGLPPQAAVRALAALRGGVFLLNSDLGTYRSVDGGSAWQPLEGPLSSGGVSQFVLWPERAKTVPAGNSPTDQPVLAATGYGIFLSRDAGALWQAHGAGMPDGQGRLPFNSRIAGLLADARWNGQIWAISDNRPIANAPAPPLALRSLDGGRTWTPVAQGLPDVVATAWAIDPASASTVAIATSEHYLRTTDAGLTWQITRLDPGSHAAIAISASNPRVVYVGGRPALRSTDGGSSWRAMPVTLPGEAGQASDVMGLAVDPANPDHLWAGSENGVAESTDGGRSWRAVGLGGQKIVWLVGAGAAAWDALYAGVAGDGLHRMDLRTGAWTAAAKGLPERSTLLALVADSRKPGELWTVRDGGGVYHSADGGANWSNIAAGLGDNLAQAAALVTSGTKAEEGSLWIGTANAGTLQFGGMQRTGSSPTTARRLSSVDARVEIVWPHGGAPVAEAKLANLGLRLFARDSLLQPSCDWSPRVTVWQAIDTAPAEPLGEASQRSVDGRPFPFWEYNDIDVARARNAEHKLYFMLQVAGAETASSVWAHAVDPRTFFPQQDVPSGIATGPIDAVDARIQIVWPHDASGAYRPATAASFVNVGVLLFKHGTRLSVPVGWQPPGLALHGAWNQEVGAPLSREALVKVNTSGAITYPVWEFTNIPVARAADPANRLYLWVRADGVETYPNIWAHGADARTAFPVPDEPIQGCIP